MGVHVDHAVGLRRNIEVLGGECSGEVPTHCACTGGGRRPREREPREDKRTADVLAVRLSGVPLGRSSQVESIRRCRYLTFRTGGEQRSDRDESE